MGKSIRIQRVSIWVQKDKGLKSVICFCLQEAEKFPKGLDDMEWEINSVRAELKELKAMHNDAQISKEAAQSELAQHCLYAKISLGASIQM